MAGGWRRAQVVGFLVPPGRFRPLTRRPGRLFEAPEASPATSRAAFFEALSSAARAAAASAVRVPPTGKFSKKAIDGGKWPPYMRLSPTGQGDARPVCVSLNRTPVSRIKTGWETRRLFDIVGLDEGTCGRRLRSPAASRRWMIGQNKPFLNGSPSSLLDGKSECPLTYPQ